MNWRPSTLLAVAAVCCGFLLAYWHVLTQLVSDWANDDNYSHGFFIVPLALFFAWERRQRLVHTPPQPSALGLLVVAGSLAVLVAGTLGAELFLTRIAIVGLIAGVTLFVAGWQHLRILSFPITFLLLMIPLPAILFNEVAFPLQLLASQFGETALRLFGIPVLREGNVITLANTSLEVAEACSGIRSLVSLLTLGIVLGYFTDSRTWTRTVIAIATVPVAIAANGLRVAGTGIAAAYVGPEAATGFLHTFSGWLMFILAFVLLLAIQQAIFRVFPEPTVVREAR
ncbi:MAG: exosortase A [Vicinamibacterales bacterium]